MSYLSNHSSNWFKNEIQFPRLIAELNAAGAFTEGSRLMEDLCSSMDLSPLEVQELVSRAELDWENAQYDIVSRTQGY